MIYARKGDEVVGGATTVENGDKITQEMASVSLPSVWMKSILCLTAKCYEKCNYYKNLGPSDLMIYTISSNFKVISRDILSTLLIIPIKNVLDEIHQVFASRISHPVTLSWHHQRLKMNFPSSPS